MGYSCNAVDSIVLSALVRALQAAHGDAGGSSNSWGATAESSAFYEIGREQRDGSITGTVNVPVPGKPGYCRKAGSFKILDGKIVRFPGSTAAQRKLAEEAADSEEARRRLSYGVGSGGGW